jgi:nitroreductase
VRTFTDEAVPDSTVVEILDDARFAPSGGNRQPWRVVLVKDPPIRQRLAELMQPVWNDYVAEAATGRTPFNVVDAAASDGGSQAQTPSGTAPNPLLDDIQAVPAVLVVAADLSRIAMMDKDLARPALTGGASIYPFCWNIILAARSRGLGGVITTFLSRAEPSASPELHLPQHHALVATIFLGHPVHQPTKLRREPVRAFLSVDSFDGAPLG